MQISEHVCLLKAAFRVAISPERHLERSVNLFLIHDRESVTLIDSGVAGAENLVFEHLAATGRKPEELRLLILTHAHPDHIGAAAPVQARTGCRVAAHAAARPWVEDTERQAAERPVPGFRQLVAGPVRIDTLLAEGDRISLDDLALEVLHTPGHSPDSISLHLPGDGVLICGDAVPLPGDLPIFTDWQASVTSLDRLGKVGGVEHLLSAWDIPRQGPEVKATLARGQSWLNRVREGVAAEARLLEPGEPLALCRAVVERLGLPPAAINPIVARSFAGCLSSGSF
jgi:glyoxylase-like metal-dependent hydrolase (beta-lactamase superfamily II)